MASEQMKDVALFSEPSEVCKGSEKTRDRGILEETMEIVSCSSRTLCLGKGTSQLDCQRQVFVFQLPWPTFSVPLKRTEGPQAVSKGKAIICSPPVLGLCPGSGPSSGVTNPAVREPETITAGELLRCGWALGKRETCLHARGFHLKEGKRGLQRGGEGLLLSLQQQRGIRVPNRGGGTATLRAGCSASLLEARLGPFPCQPLPPGRDEGVKDCSSGIVLCFLGPRGIAGLPDVSPSGQGGSGHCRAGDCVGREELPLHS